MTGEIGEFEGKPTIKVVLTRKEAEFLHNGIGHELAVWGGDGFSSKVSSRILVEDDVTTTTSG